MCLVHLGKIVSEEGSASVKIKSKRSLITPSEYYLPTVVRQLIYSLFNNER